MSAATLDLIPISFLPPNGYLLFSSNKITRLRREFNICGTLTGSLPQIPQQNVFLGLPLQLMSEEARLLVDAGVAYIVDDASVHSEAGLKGVRKEDKEAYLQDLRDQRRVAAEVQSKQKKQQQEIALKKMAEKHTRGPGDQNIISASNEQKDNDFLFGSAQGSWSQRSSASTEVPAFTVTPRTSNLLLPPAPSSATTKTAQSIKVPPSYALYKHLHSKGHFISPGLRFGCQYMVYPGDPLRFHSHFLTTGYDWDDEIDLMDLVGGGRLGTGVKKTFLIGGQEPAQHKEAAAQDIDRVQTFSIEWAGM